MSAKTVRKPTAEVVRVPASKIDPQTRDASNLVHALSARLPIGSVSAGWIGTWPQRMSHEDALARLEALLSFRACVGVLDELSSYFLELVAMRDTSNTAQLTGLKLYAKRSRRT